MGNIKKFISKNGSLVGLILMIIIVSLIDSSFIKLGNLSNVLRQVSINGLIALGMTFVILIGGIDLSVGSIFSLTGAALAYMLLNGVNGVLALIITLLLGVILGLINGILITKGKLQPFIATLGTVTLYRGITRVFTNGRPFTGFNNEFISFIGKGYVFEIAFPIIILVLMTLICMFISKKTVFGKEIYAVGGNERTALFSAINVNKVKIKVYMLSGLLATMSAVILTSRLNSAQPNAGSGYELDAIAAVVLGGASMSGGRGRVYGTIIGILIIGVLNNGLNILNVSSFYQDVVKGVVILLAVLIDPKR